jgi:hypothetical protein
MFIKLARFENRDGNDFILTCCKANNVDYIPIFRDYFGMLTRNFEMMYGREDFLTPTDTSLKAFVDVYTCAAKAGVPYVALQLTGAFFRNIGVFCREFNIKITKVDSISKYNSSFETEDGDNDDIQSILDDEESTITSMTLRFDNVSIVINNRGYIDIGDRGSFFDKNGQILIEMIRICINEQEENE